MLLRKNGFGAALVVCGLLAAPHPASAQTFYSILDLGVLPGDFASFANGLNDTGQVVGISQTAGGATHGFLYSGGSMTDIGSLGGDTYANAINGAGNIVGSAFNPTTGAFQAFRTTPGGSLNAAALLGTFPTAGSMDSFGYGIIAAGRTVVFAFIGTSNHAYRTTAAGGIDAASDLNTLGGDNSYAFGINTSGQVAGYSDTAPDINGNSVIHAFRTSAAGTMSDLGTLGGTNSYATALNDSGQVIGYSDLSDGSQHAFRTSANTAINPLTDDLGTLGGLFSYAYYINSSGITVGYSSTAAGEQRAFVVQNTTMLDLTNLLFINSDGWVLTNANAVNTSGQIAGTGLINGEQHAYLLTPLRPTGTPEPGTWTFLFASTGSGLLLARRKFARGKRACFRVK
ncbi:MAG: extracellular repeat protein family [Chthonomonadales bacterium]|nr:extracellular repeat protein family [Chthonomonadales bacterium]